MVNDVTSDITIDGLTEEILEIIDSMNLTYDMFYWQHYAMMTILIDLF